MISQQLINSLRGSVPKFGKTKDDCVKMMFATTYCGVGLVAVFSLHVLATSEICTKVNKIHNYLHIGQINSHLSAQRKSNFAIFIRKNSFAIICANAN